MKYQPSALSLILCLFIFSSCNHKDSTIPKQDSLARNNNQSLAGQLYLFAPEYDSTNFVATGACDCCSANTVFLDDSIFLYISYCDDGCSYVRGIYHVRDSTLSMNFDSLIVEKSYPYQVDDSGKYVSTDVKFSTMMNKSASLNYKKLDYKGRIVFRGENEYGAIDTGGTVGEMMKSIRFEGIWDRLTGKSKVVDIHSQAAAMPELLGVWARSGEKTASFEILENSIYYTDQGRDYSYHLQFDTLKIKQQANEIAYQVTMNGTDTLILDGEKRNVYYRFKN